MTDDKLAALLSQYARTEHRFRNADYLESRARQERAEAHEINEAASDALLAYVSGTYPNSKQPPWDDYTLTFRLDRGSGYRPLVVTVRVNLDRVNDPKEVTPNELYVTAAEVIDEIVVDMSPTKAS